MERRRRTKSEPAAKRDRLQLIGKGAKADIDRAAAWLDCDTALEAVVYAVTEEDADRGAWRLDAYPASDEEAARIGAILGAAPGVRTQVGPLADADWLALAFSGLPPVRVGRFFVFGAHDRGRVPANAVALRIEAGAAFGTGQHATTRGCLIALDAALKARRLRRVLDIGCGTGILAIAAAQAGAEVAVGVDVDPIAVRVARENASINGGRARFFVGEGPSRLPAGRRRGFDLVFANILAGPLIAMAASIVAAAAPGGTIVLSGLLRAQARAVTAAYVGRRLRLDRRIQREAWTTLVLRRRRFASAALSH